MQTLSKKSKWHEAIENETFKLLNSTSYISKEGLFISNKFRINNLNRYFSIDVLIERVKILNLNWILSQVYFRIELSELLIENIKKFDLASKIYLSIEIIEGYHFFQDSRTFNIIEDKILENSFVTPTIFTEKSEALIFLRAYGEDLAQISFKKDQSPNGDTFNILLKLLNDNDINKITTNNKIDLGVNYLIKNNLFDQITSAIEILTKMFDPSSTQLRRASLLYIAISLDYFFQTINENNEYMNESIYKYLSNYMPSSEDIEDWNILRQISKIKPSNYEKLRKMVLLNNFDFNDKIYYFNYFFLLSQMTYRLVLVKVDFSGILYRLY